MAPVWIAGYWLEYDDVAAFLKKKDLLLPEEEMNDTTAQQVFKAWVITQHKKPTEDIVPWPQYAERQDENRSYYVTGLQTRVVAAPEAGKKPALHETPFDISSRDKFIEMTGNSFEPLRMQFYVCPSYNVLFPIHPEVPRR
ncbi:uncharacterized protein STEHIDRAFT_123473 [Stereum hirsutum FP-91666 SS1]|uniref:uncharacterized protein n=1 Tax=Stereum hirsutum (strain FP-91666) TaxID=721885 RepID=UPI000444947F|nr:uncharacterized protein STEHIDRAFT_123473 [Stereum hirsutum FP-91666 SS1]EIM83904.1 hypothetical protein STEHIDRAFT_123473 [Stereum hirsutum FP-91666 SS1]